MSDNDGAAFVTKAEFEEFKKNFAAQIDNYNNSIDSKSDGAIAYYLVGIDLAKKVHFLLIQVVLLYLLEKMMIFNFLVCKPAKQIR